jgi:hypothetical protein
MMARSASGYEMTEVMGLPKQQLALSIWHLAYPVRSSPMDLQQ